VKRKKKACRGGGESRNHKKAAAIRKGSREKKRKEKEGWWEGGRKKFPGGGEKRTKITGISQEERGSCRGEKEKKSEVGRADGRKKTNKNYDADWIVPQGGAFLRGSPVKIRGDQNQQLLSSVWFKCFQGRDKKIQKKLAKEENPKGLAGRGKPSRAPGGRTEIGRFQ